MKRMLCSLTLAALALAPVVAAEKTEKPFSIPEVTQWKPAKGELVWQRSCRIVVPKGAPAALRDVARMLADDSHRLLGFRPAIVEGKAGEGDIELKGKAKDNDDESYRLDIGRTMRLTADGRRGLYYATRTLLQLMEQNSALPCGSMTDKPAYKMRGFMIDCGRKYIPMNYLRKLVRVMAYYKMNTLQVHLNDNGFKQYFQNDWSKTYAAFRMECETFPGLTAPDGFYTKKEFIAFQQFADSLGVEIIPEFDVPAHSLAFTQYKPEIGSTKYGMDHLDLFKPETYAFVDALLAEYLKGPSPVFIGKRMHVGTDEYSNADPAVVEKFRYFTDHCIREVEKYGKQAMVWGALTHAKGQTPVKSDHVLMNVWHNNYAQPDSMKKLGYEMVSIPDGYIYIVPAAGYYHDYLNTSFLYNKWTPSDIAGKKFAANDPSVVGGMFAVWNDHVGNGISVSDIHHRIMPSMQTLSAKMWDGAAVTVPYERFNTLRAGLSEAPGVNELGRYPHVADSVVLRAPRLVPSSATGFYGMGYNYAIEFDIEGADETPGTELARCDASVFYLSDPVSGMMGFARDGYLYKFRYRVMPGTKAHIRIEGTNKTTRLYVNGRLIDDLNIRPLWFDNKGKDRLNIVSTLFFPLQHTGAFKSRITQFVAKQLP